MRGGRAIPGLIAAALLAAGVLAVAVPAGAVEVVVRAAPHDGYGRIVFNWQQPVAKQVAVESGRLVVRFSQPIEADYAGVARSLEGYVADPRPGADGRSVSFRLAQPVELESFYTGTAVVVDLHPTAAAASPAPEPTSEPVQSATATAEMSRTETRAVAQATPAANTPRINVRTGEHGDYTRIVFDWEQEVDYSVDAAGGVVTVRFQRPATFTLDALTGSPPAYVGAARASTGDAASQVTVAIPASSTVRHLRAGTKVVVDIRAPTAGDSPVALPTETAEVPPAPAPAAPEPQAAEPQAPKPQAPEPQAPEVAAPPPPAGPETPPAAAETAAAPPGDAQTAPEVQPEAPPGAPTALEPPAPAQPAPEAQPATGVAAEALAPVGGDGAAAGTAELRFPWQEPVAAAVFFRGGRLWIAFDRPATLDPAAVEAAGNGTIQGVRQVPAANGLVLVMDTARNIQPSLKRDGNAWIVELKADRFRLASPIPVKVQPDSPVGPRVFLPIAEPGNPIAVTDPDVGDNLVIVPVVPLSNGIPTDFQYPQFDLSRSAQGVAIAPRIDDLRVRTTRQGIELTAGRELAVSPVGAGAEASARLEAFRPITRIVPEEDWEKLTLPRRSQFTPRRQQLEAAAGVAEPGAEREQARFALARFLVANGYGAEALGVMQTMLEARPEVADEAEFRLFHGIANFLLARYHEATADFGQPVLDRNDEGTFWRAATRAQAGDLLGAARDLQLNGVIPRPYPRGLRTDLGTLVAEAALEVGDPTLAENSLEAVRLDDPTVREAAYIHFVEGKLEEFKGNFDAAVGIWEEVMAGEDRWMRARATVARTELLLKLQRLPVPEAIGAYEGLRFVWRGDEFEFRLLRRLGNLYLDEAMFRDGLSILRQAATHFRENPEAPQVTQQMADTFNYLFLEDGADRLPPVSAIALYDEFRELTPVGEPGDRMIQQLADRLVTVDLLDRAASLLQSQVRFRLDGLEKSRVGARLALIRIFAEEHQQALETLDGTAAANEPPELSTQRRHLRARALIGLDRNTEAMALLEEDASRDAELLRVEVYWNAGDWRSAAQTLNRLVRLYEAKPNEPLDQRQASAVLNYAVALTLSGGERALQRLRRDYGPAISQTQFAGAFQLITNPAQLGLLSPSQVPAEVAEAQSFLTTYRDKLKAGRPLSAIN